jgi:hypothetical protein
MGERGLLVSAYGAVRCPPTAPAFEIRMTSINRDRAATQSCLRANRAASGSRPSEPSAWDTRTPARIYDQAARLGYRGLAWRDGPKRRPVRRADGVLRDQEQALVPYNADYSHVGVVSAATNLLHGAAQMGDAFVGWATVGVAAATACLLVAAIWAGNKGAAGVKEQIDVQRDIDEGHIATQQAIERQHRVLDHQAILSSRDFVEMSAPGIELFRQFQQDANKAEAEWQEMAVLQQMTILAVLNYYELVAGEYNSDALDRQAADVNLAYATIVMWEYAAAFINYLRNADSAYYAEWKYMYDHYGATIRTRAKEGPPRTSAPRIHRPSASALVLHPTPPAGETIHLPGPTIVPVMTAVGITLFLVGITTTSCCRSSAPSCLRR